MTIETAIPKHFEEITDSEEIEGGMSLEGVYLYAQELEGFGQHTELWQYLDTLDDVLRSIEAEVSFGDPQQTKSLLLDVLSGTVWENIKIEHAPKLPDSEEVMTLGMGDCCYLLPIWNEDGDVVELLFSTELSLEDEYLV